MTDLAAILLDAARASAEPVEPIAPIRQDEIDAVLAAMPEMAREGRKHDAPWFVLYRSEDKRGDMLAGRVADWLAGEGITTSFEPRVLPHDVITLRVDYASLAAYAERTKRRAWHTEAERAWKDRAGAEASVQVEGGAVYFWTAPPHRGGKSHLDTLAALDRDPSQAVDGAASALRLPRWTLRTLADTFRTVAGDEALVELALGRWEHGRYVPSQSVRFVVGDSDWYIDMDAARALLPDDLAMQAAAQLVNFPVEPAMVAAPSPVPASAVEPAPAAPVTRRTEPNYQRYSRRR